MRGATRDQRVVRVADHDVSIHAPRAGRDARGAARRAGQVGVSIHAPRAGRDSVVLPTVGVVGLVSIHAPRAGRDLRVAHLHERERGFNPRAPCGARPARPMPYFSHDSFQSTRPVRGATRSASSTPRSSACFNPRAPCGARHAAMERCRERNRVSIHAPRAGRDHSANGTDVGDTLFQSTRPVRGATSCLPGSCRCPRRFNPRAPCGARPSPPPRPSRRPSFNPRAPCGARQQRGYTHFQGSCFNPRAPCGARLCFGAS